MLETYRSPELGEAKEIALERGAIRYHERGSGTPIVFVHGLLVNANLWRKVVAALGNGFRCITPDWPLGSHSLPMPADADLTPPALAKLIADFLTALDLEDVVLVGNDTGGALGQLVVTEHPERVGRLVLTPCDAYDNFPPRMFRPLQWVAPVPGALRLIGMTLGIGPLRRLPNAYGWLSKRPVEREVMDSYLSPAVASADVRRDLRKAFTGVSPRYTMAAAEKLSGFTRPVLIAWAKEDRFFPFAHAEKLSEAFPNARLEPIEDSYTFVPEDQPQRLAELIASFVQQPMEAAA